MNTKEIGAALALLKAKAIEQVPAAVEGWLDDHPEATTTVEDGAITKAKLTSTLKEEIETNTSDVTDVKNALQDMDGGTTGQVLRKRSNSDYAFEWADIPSAEEIANAVDDWLDEHPEATTTVDFSIARKVFPTVSDMVADLTLKTGDNVATRGYYISGDDGAANYVVSQSTSGHFYITLENGLYANMLSEKGILKAESIGIRAYISETQNPDQTIMDRNVSLFNTAVYNGVLLLFGKGYFYFSDAIQLAHKNTYAIRGVARDDTHLIFPNSDGLCFCDSIYYNYYIIKGLHIHSYGHCIVVDDSALTVLDSHFEWLSLQSDTGDCFHGPDYNVYWAAGSNILDTCVQNAVFDFCNLSAPQSAGIANVMGMHSTYSHLNFVSCKYAFRNCDGTVVQANNLGTQQDYYIYYDKAYSYGLRWRFINVNAEALAKGFIHSEPYVPDAGFDPETHKPNPSMNVAVINVVAIASGWSLYGVSSGHDVYPWVVHDVRKIALLQAQNMITPSNYPNVYDTTTVKAPIKCLNDDGLGHYSGGNTIDIYNANANRINTHYGNDEDNLIIAANNNGGYVNIVNERVPTYKEIYADVIFGGKGLNVWVVNASDIGNQPQPPQDKVFFDVLAVNVDTQAQKSLSSIAPDYISMYPGKIITLYNLPNSLNNLTFMDVNATRQYPTGGLSKDSINQYNEIRLAPGEQIQLVSVWEATNNGTRKAWRPLEKEYIKDDHADNILYNAIKSTSGKQILDAIDGYYIPVKNNMDITDIKEATVANGNYGNYYVLTPCSQGDEFTIINGLGNANTTRLWAFVNESGMMLASAGNWVVEDYKTIEAPQSAAYLVVNSLRKPIVFKSN